MQDTKPVSWKDVRIGDGFWGEWQRINAEATADAIYNRFHETGRIDAMRLEWREGMDNAPHVFWDSDVAKWIECAAYLLYYAPNEAIQAKMEAVLDNIERGQDESGYFRACSHCKKQPKYDISTT